MSLLQSHFFCLNRNADTRTISALDLTHKLHHSFAKFKNSWTLKSVKLHVYLVFSVRKKNFTHIALLIHLWKEEGQRPLLCSGEARGDPPPAGGGPGREPWGPPDGGAAGLYGMVGVGGVRAFWSRTWDEQRPGRWAKKHPRFLLFVQAHIPEWWLYVNIAQRWSKHPIHTLILPFSLSLWLYLCPT